MNSSYVIIPARSGSKGVLNKNLRKIHGVNLTIRSLVHAMQITKKNNIVLSTNSYEVVESVSDFFKIKCPEIQINKLIDFGEFSLHFRSEHLSSDQSLITDVMSNIYELLIAAGRSPSIFCLLQPIPKKSKFGKFDTFSSMNFTECFGTFLLTFLAAIMGEASSPPPPFSVESLDKILFKKYESLVRQGPPTPGEGRGIPLLGYPLFEDSINELRSRL